MNSQNDEERYISEFFANQARGSFLDIGAYDGVALSNSYALVRKGWCGVAVEPSPHAFIALMANYAQHPEIILVNAAVTSNGQMRNFWDGGLYSTMHKGNFQRWKSLAKFRRPFYIATLTLETLGAAFGWDYDFISIDAEGESVELALGLPLEHRPVPRMLCIEHDGHKEQLLAHFAPLGFSEVACNAENLILAK